ncbi:MAG: hypothetical protein FWG91_00755 [Lachnospiraceae bacterium]|nr:hypothetical protein [Lachnospiraceae bacterium]
MLNKFFTAGDEDIPYYITENYGTAKLLFANLPYDCYYIFHDANVSVAEMLDVIFSDTVHYEVAIHVSESSKTFNELNRIIELLIDMGVTRNSCLIAVGGGVLGNMIGLAAVLLCRGIPFIHIPTTIMAASDSVLSLKQAINSKHVKNIIGSFCAPEFICAVYPLFKTLSRREHYSGLVEFVKNVLIFNYLNEDFINTYDYFNYHQYNQFEKLITLSIEMKSSIICNDKFEKNRAICFEYGHTFGHAIEMITKGVVNHGESVAFGMMAAARVSRDMGCLSDNNVTKHDELLKFIIPQIYDITNIDPECIIREMERDNKRGYIAREEGALPLVLLDKNNNCEETCIMINVSKMAIEKAIRETCVVIKNWCRESY